MQEPPPSFATFWAGDEVSAFEASCLHSFVVRGYRTILYSYGTVRDVPAGVELLDAATIAPAESMHRFWYSGKPNLSHFSDYFRYLLFRRTEHIWIDADMLLLRTITIPLGRMLLARERDDSICGAIMRLDNTRPELARLVSATEAAMDHELRWGETGPRLITSVFGQPDLFQGSLEPKYFFPLTHDDCWKVFLPEYREECEQLCSSAFGVHLWNNIVDKLGVWKCMAPPAGSFLSCALERDGSLRFFRDTYPAPVIRQMVENWCMRLDGSDLGILNLSRQVLPSILRTARNYRTPTFFRSNSRAM